MGQYWPHSAQRWLRLLVAFYHEPRLYWVAVVSGATFIFNGLSAQHGALLQRGMRFVTQAKIDVLSLAVGSGTGIVMALLGCGYWSLVGMAMAISIIGAAAVMACCSLGPRSSSAQVRHPVDAPFWGIGHL